MIAHGGRYRVLHPPGIPSEPRAGSATLTAAADHAAAAFSDQTEAIGWAVPLDIGAHRLGGIGRCLRFGR